jgi:hypothetical protein
MADKRRFVFVNRRLYQRRFFTHTIPKIGWFLDTLREHGDALLFMITTAQVRHSSLYQSHNNCNSSTTNKQHPRVGDVRVRGSAVESAA